MVSDEDKQVGSQDDLDKNSNRDLDSLIVDCSDLILNKELNLFEKMMVHPEIYKFKPPT